MSVFSDKLSELMKKKDISDEQLAELVNVNRTTVTRWRTGERSPKMEKLPEISAIFNVDARIFVGEQPNTLLTQITETTSKLEEPRQLKVYSFAEKQLEEQNNNIVEFPKNLVTGRSTAAGDPINGDLEDENAYTMIVDKLEIPKSADEIVTIAGDSMEPTYEQGSQVFIHWQSEVEQGEVAVVAIQDEGVTCKKVYYDWEEGEIILRSINEKYKDRIFSMDEIRIIGKVVM